MGRPANLEDFERRFTHLRPEYSLRDRVQQKTSKSWRKITPWSILKWLASFVPAIQWLSKYKPKYLPMDILAGLTVGIVNVPQGMAYGLLAGLPPVYGLYTSFFLPLAYTFFGTSRHAAIGTFAVTSIMVSSVLDRHMPGAGSENRTGGFWCGYTMDEQHDHNANRIEIAVVLTLLVSFVHIICGMLKLGFLTAFFSDQLIKGLTTGAAIHVLTSQIQHIFGLEPVLKGYSRDNSELLEILRFYVCFFMKIQYTNWVPFVTTFLCIVVLLIVKMYIDPKTRPKIRFPIPIELILVIITTIISWQLNLDHSQNKSNTTDNATRLDTVGKIVTGFPTPSVPKLSEYGGQLIGDAISIGIMLYAIEVSIAKLFAKKYGYEIDPNQEWFGLGIAHFFGSFFQCHPGGASMSRSMVQGSQGGKSQLVNLINAIIILAVLLGIAGLFEHLPTCTLSAIIVVSLKGLFLQFKELPTIFRRSKLDFSVWIVTFSGTIFFNVTFGLIIGVGFSVLTLLYRLMMPNSSAMGRVDGTEVLEDLGSYEELRESAGIKIFKFEAPLIYVNVERFKNDLYKRTGVDPLARKRKIQKLKRRQEKKEKKLTKNRSAVAPIENGAVTIEVQSISPTGDIDRAIEFVIINCSLFGNPDMMAVDTLKQTFLDYKEVDITVFYAGFPTSAREKLERADFFSKVPKRCIFPDTFSALIEASMNLSQFDERF